MFDMEILGVTGQVALFELIVARKDTHAMAKISSPAIRNEFTHLSIWPMNTTAMTRRGVRDNTNKGTLHADWPRCVESERTAGSASEG